MRIKHGHLHIVGEHIDGSGNWAPWRTVGRYVGAESDISQTWIEVASMERDYEGRADRRNLRIEFQVPSLQVKRPSITIPVASAQEVRDIFNGEWTMEIDRRIVSLDKIADLAESILEGGADVKLDADRILDLIGREVE